MRVPKARRQLLAEGPFATDVSRGVVRRLVKKVRSLS